MPKKIVEEEKKTNRLTTVVSQVEKEKIQEWCEKNNTTVYSLMRDLLLKKVKLNEGRRY